MIWSEFGMSSRFDGNLDGEKDAHADNQCIEEATVRVNQFLLTRYAVSVLAASAFVKWATAYTACRILGRRFGLSLPDGLSIECDWYIEQLTAIRDGQANLLADSGLATPRHDFRPAVTNHTIDGRYRRSKVRRVEATSTNTNPEDGVKEKPAPDYPYEGYFL